MSDKKACQFCGEEILVVALKCKHCGSNLAVGALNAGNSAAATSTSDDERESSNEPSFWTQLAVYGVIFVIGVGLLSTNPSRDEFKSFLNQKIEGGIEKVLFKASSDKDTQGILGSIVKGIASAAMSKILHRQNYYVFSIFELDTSLIRAIGVDVPQVKFLGIAGNFIPLNRSSWERITKIGARASSVSAKDIDDSKKESSPNRKDESNGVREGVTSKNDNNKPLENWKIKTSDYNIVLQYMKEDTFYADVPPPNCSDNSDKGLQLICAREDFKNIAWVIKRLKIKAEENATKRQLDHKTAYSGVYKVDCNDQDCVGKFLQQSFYGAIEEAGISYLLAQPETATAPQDSLSINNRWLGMWRSGSAEKLTISETKFGDCQWVVKETAAQNKCFAYYSETITKKRLVEIQSYDLSNLSRWLQQKKITAADYPTMKADSESNKKILDEITDDTFRTIFVDYGVGASTVNVYFLDKAYIYKASFQGDREDSPIYFEITKYRKQ